eukprot:2205320-Rhodomonas_salina.1
MVLCANYAMPGTELLYGATRQPRGIPAYGAAWYRRAGTTALCSYALPSTDVDPPVLTPGTSRRFPVLKCTMVLPGPTRCSNLAQAPVSSAPYPDAYLARAERCEIKENASHFWYNRYGERGC